MKKVLSKAARFGRKLVFWRRRGDESGGALPERPASRREVGEAIEAALREQREQLTEVFTAILSDQLDRMSRPLEEVHADQRELLDAVRSLSRTVVPAVSKLEASGTTVLRSLDDVRAGARRIESQCEEQAASLDRHLEGTRESLTRLKTTYDERLQDLGRQHGDQLERLRDERKRRRAEEEKARRFVDDGLKLASEELETVASRLEVSGRALALPDNNVETEGRGRARQSLSLLASPFLRARARMKANARARGLHEQLLLEENRLRTLRREIDVLRSDSLTRVTQEEEPPPRRRVPQTELPFEPSVPLTQAAETLC